MATTHEVAVIFNLYEDYGRKVAAGISQFAREAGNWRIYRPFLSVPPVGIVSRRSTDILRVTDTTVVDALRFIRNHLSMPLQAAAVARHVGLSRAMLDIRFQRALGRSIYAEISRGRLAAVRELLLGTDLPLKAIAARTGFRSVEYLVTTFRRSTGKTPGGFRKANQLPWREPSLQA